MADPKYSYLSRCIERTQDLPADLHRLLGLIKDLDERAQKAMRLAEDTARNKLKVARQDGPTPSKRQRLSKTDCAMDPETLGHVQEALSLANEKFDAAEQLYDTVDKHIQLLDDDLKAFEEDLRKDKRRLGIADETAASKAAPREAANSKAAPATASATTKKGGRRKKEAEPEPVQQAVSAGEAAEDGLLEGGEPRYCVCHDVSRGNMVACDWPDCEYEWFHFECVGLTVQPEGEWFCPDCEKLARKAGRL